MRVLAGIVLITALAACGACGSAPHEVRGASPPDIASASVLIRITCGDGRVGYGSGLALSPTAVLSAGHVARPEGCDDATFTIAQGDAEHRAVPEVVAAKDDASVFRVTDGGVSTYDAVTVGLEPKIGERVCWAAQRPRSSWHCALVQPSQGDGLISLDYPVEPGNSGSALFDARGYLVGVVVEYDAAPSTGQIDGGRATDVTGSLSWIASVR